MPATIRLGSKGKDVATWQRILGIPESSVFDGDTKERTIDWQKSHKLVPDGIVGPATWGAATGTSFSGNVPVSTAQNADKAAYEAAKRALPSLKEPAIQYLVTVARGEGFYGSGWGNPSAKTIEESKKHGLTGYEGKGSNNWGAVQGMGSAGSFPHVDFGWLTPEGLHWKGQGPKVWGPYVAPYKRYSTQDDGAKDMAMILLKSNVLNALSNGDLEGAVKAQHANGYFELDPKKYFDAVQRNYAQLVSNLGWSPVLTSAAKKGMGMLLVLALAAGGIWAIGKGLKG